MKTARYLIPLAIPISAPALAEETFEVAPIVVEVFRSGVDEGSIPGAVEIIYGEEIVENSDGNLARYLTTRVASFTPYSETMSGASQTIRGRGIQVLLNGVPLGSALRGFTRELAQIDPESIDRIEIVKGATALYGNGATGAIINIITRAAGEQGVRGDLSARISFQDEDPGESFGTDLSVGAEARVGDFGIRFDLGATFTGAMFDGAGRQMPSDPLIGQGGGDQIERYTFTGTADYTIGDHEFELSGSYTRLDQDLDFFPNYATDPVSTDFGSPYVGEPVFDESYTLSGTYRNQEFGLGALTFQTFYSDAERRAAFVPAGPANPLVYYSGDPLNPQDPDAQSVLFTEQFGARLTISTDVDFGVLSWGIDYQRDKVSQEILDGRDIIAPMVQDSVAGFVQLDVPLGTEFDLRAGMRYETFFLEVQDFTRPEVFQLPGFIIPAVDVTGGDFTYDALVFNFGGVWHATEELDVFAGFSQGFSVPDVGSFTRRAINANPFDPSPISFASIRPSASIVNSYELGTRYTTGDLRLAASVFFSTSEDGTVFDPATNAVTQQPERIWGAELNIEGDVTEELTLGAVLAYTEGRYDSDGDGVIDAWLPNNRIVAPVTATLYADYDFQNGWGVGGELLITSGRDHDPAGNIEPTATLNLHAFYGGDFGRFSLGVTNLFDAEQLNPTGTSVRNIPVGAEGRRFWMAYSVAF